MRIFLLIHRQTFSIVIMLIERHKYHLCTEIHAPCVWFRWKRDGKGFFVYRQRFSLFPIMYIVHRYWDLIVPSLGEIALLFFLKKNHWIACLIVQVVRSDKVQECLLWLIQFLCLFRTANMSIVCASMCE